MAINLSISSIGENIYATGAAVGEWIGRACTSIYDSLPSLSEIAAHVNNFWEGLKPYIVQTALFFTTSSGLAVGCLALAAVFGVWALNTDQEYTAYRVVLVALSVVFGIAAGMHGINSGFFSSKIA